MIYKDVPFIFLIALAALGLGAKCESDGSGPGYNICYTGAVLGGETGATSFENIEGTPLFRAKVEIFDENNVYTMMLTEKDGLYGESSGWESFCTPELGAGCELGAHCPEPEDMRIRFSATGCDELIYTPDIDDGLDYGPPTPTANVTLNAQLRCDL